MVKQAILNRSKNLKSFINKFNSIIYSIKFYKKRNDDSPENIIINEFSKILKNIKLKNEEGHKSVFKNSNIIMNNILINKFNLDKKNNIKITNKSIDNKLINNLNNMDTQMLFYFIFNLNRLIDYNDKKNIKNNICYLIVKVIQFLFNSIYINYDNLELRKFEFIINVEENLIDETMKVVGLYQELLTQEEIDDPERKEAEYTAQEEMNSLDIDDYEIDDDIDGSMEALN